MTTRNNNNNEQDRPLQPVSSRFPSNADVVEDSNVPFSCVVRPLASTAATATTTTTTTTAVLNLTSLVKCEHCGAPHVRRGITHTSVDARTTLPPHVPAIVRQCHLCLHQTETPTHAPPTRPNARNNSSNDNASSSTSTIGGWCYEDVAHLPLRWMGVGTQNLPNVSHAPTAAAPSCPLLWIVVLDGSCEHSTYWCAVSDALSRIIVDVPNASSFGHVQVALVTTAGAVTYENGYENDATGRPKTGSREIRRRTRTWGVWQLSSPTPSVLHHTIVDDSNDTNHDNRLDNNDNDAALTTLHQSIWDHAVPLPSPHVGAAIRSLVDYRPVNELDINNDKYEYEESTAVGPDVEGTLQVLLDSMSESGMYPVGRNPPSTSVETVASDGPSPLLPYAGGKVTFLLANPPSSVAAASLPSSYSHNLGGVSDGSNGVGSNAYSASSSNPSELPSSPHYEPPMGGSGGRIAFPQRVGHRFSPQPTSPTTGPPNSCPGNSVQDNDHDLRTFRVDWSPDHLQVQYPHLDPDLPDTLAQVGRECADAALGVDVLCLVEMHDEDTGSANESNDDDDSEYGPPHSRSMPDFGLCWYSTLCSKSGASGPVVLAIPQHGFSSSSKNHIERSHMLHRELMARVPWNPSLVFGGELRLRLSPGFEVDDSTVEVSASDPRQYQLASLCSDRGMFGAVSSVLESSNLWRMGVADPHTTYCVDLRVNPSQIDLANYSQSSIRPVVQACFAYTAVLPDAESKSYVTVRQMRIQTLPVGPLCESTEDLYGSVDPEALAVVLFHKLSLASFQDGIREVPGIAEDWLQSTLVSVYQSAERLAARTEERLPGLDNNGSPPSFYENERLLDRGGELSEEQVLLAQGHNRLRSVSLMTYLIMNCDAFRFDPRRTVPLDLRMSALAQMQNLAPNALTRCIAPRVQLWSSAKGEVEPVLDVVDLRAYSVSSTLDEFSHFDLVLFIDTPYLIAAIDGQYWSHYRAQIGTRNGACQPSVESKKASLPLVLGPALRRSIADAAASYRAPPLTHFELDYTPEKAARVVGLLLDVLVEDAASPATHHDNYDAWKADIAATVRE